MAWSVILTAEILLEPLLWFQLVFLGTVCNVFFFLGPALEAYGRYFGVWSKTLSLLLFLVGLFVTGLLATGFLIVRAQ